jgi:hypothetical protein
MEPFEPFERVRKKGAKMMNCETTTRYLDDFLDGALDSTKEQEIQSHINSCESCRKLVQRQQALGTALRELPVPRLRRDFAQFALNKTRQQHAFQRKRKAAMGGAIAAGFALFFIVNLLVNAPVDNHSVVPEVTLVKDQIHEIKLVINSKRSIEDATFSVQLPRNVALKGFPNQQAIRWKGHLRQGQNLLVLPVIAQGPVDGELITMIKEAEKQKAFHINIQMDEINRSRSSYRNVGVA